MRKNSKPPAYTSSRKDLFLEAKEKLTIPRAWELLELRGIPAKSCLSPFREENNPSFSIYADGRLWRDHGTGEGGNVIDFLKVFLGSCSAVREWLLRHLEGLPVINYEAKSPPEQVKKIVWPEDFHEVPPQDLYLFAEIHGVSLEAAREAVITGRLKFALVGGAQCFVITDSEGRAAEIRPIYGGPFGNGLKAFPLAGVDKSWLVGASRLRNTDRNTRVLLVEGATDLLTAIHLYATFRESRIDAGLPECLWVPVALLGATCKRLAPECAELLRGRHVRIVPDADKAGDGMKAHWSILLSNLGCTVDVVDLERGYDLSDVAGSLNPEGLFA